MSEIYFYQEMSHQTIVLIVLNRGYIKSVMHSKFRNGKILREYSLLSRICSLGTNIKF